MKLCWMPLTTAALPFVLTTATAQTDPKPFAAQTNATNKAGATNSAAPILHRVFVRSRFNVDAILARPYDKSVPFGASGNRVWATSPQGWGFSDGVQLIYMTNLNAFDITVRGGKNAVYVAGKADYAPSHVHIAGMVAPPATKPDMTATASFTFTTDKVENPLTQPFNPEKRWTCWSSGHREDTYTVNFGKTRKLWGASLYFFSDVEEGGGCAPPETVRVEAYRDNAWHEIPTRPITPQKGLTSISFLGIAPEQASQLRFTFRNRGTSLYTGLYGFEPSFADVSVKHHALSIKKNAPMLNAQHSTLNTFLRVEADKWITQNDVLVTRLTVRNTSRSAQPLFVRMDSGLSGILHGYADQRSIEGFPLYLSAAASDGKTRDTSFITDLKPGERRAFTFACAVGKTRAEADAKLKRVLADPNPLASHVAQYRGWFDRNIAYFDCSDARVAKMYYHRWYNVKKNSMEPDLGKMQHKTFAEGRWTSDWYANAITYGAGHQIREARWLRDPSYAWGHLQTWTDNPRPDGIYPSHVTLKGQQGGQYTDWISSTAWDVSLVHPDKSILANVADTLARNTEAWRKIYGWNDSPLLVVDSHWWTGMEWQPSFFSFADYKTGGGGGEDRKYMTALRRVDLTAYNYANAENMAKVFRELGRTEDADRMQALADATRNALLKEMWNPQSHWFVDLRASDNAQSPAKEIIGLYPFTFEMPPKGQGYEAIWQAALDPNLFWTPHPLASTAKDCPAYAQNGWPVGPGGSICMWNGPSWPHANSLVLQAMANTLRHYAPSALTRQKLLDLFSDFTRVQYKDGDMRYPWTGEFYNGDTAEWKTTQRDYNHSTWIDPLVHDLLGLVARPNNILEIDPLLPNNAWSHFVLDGQAYRGHDVTIAYDRNGGHVAPDFKGFAVYLDGKQIYHGSQPAHVLYDMAAHKTLAAH